MKIMRKSARGITYDLMDALRRNPTTIMAGDNISAAAIEEIERLQTELATYDSKEPSDDT